MLSRASTLLPWLCTCIMWTRPFAAAAEDDLKHVRHVIHEVDRIVPANDEIARFEVGARIGFLVARMPGRTSGVAVAAMVGR